MSILEILEAHRTLASAPDDKVCACDRTWRPNAEYRTHLAEVLEKHMQEREAAAKDEHRREWADHISEWHATVGAPICHVDAVVQALRSDHVPFGKGATNGRD